MKNIFSLDTISKKLLFILMSVAIVSTVIVTLVFSAYELTSAKREQVQSLQSLSDMLSPNITAAVLFDDQETIKELIKPVLLRSDILSINVTNIENQVLGQLFATNVSKDTLSNNENLTNITTPLTLDNQDYGYLTIIADDSYIEERIAFYIKFLLFLLLSTFAVSLFLSLFLQRKFLSPILYLADTADKITTSHDYSLRAKQHSKDEIGQLATCFNSMLDTIEQRESVLESQVKSRTEELENANIQLHEFAYQDGLTNLPNRRYFIKSYNPCLKSTTCILR